MSKIALSAPVAGVGTATIKGPETASDIEFQLPPRAGQVLVAPPVFRAVMSVVQTGFASNTPVKVALNAIFYDAGGGFNTSTYRYQPSVAGYYQINAMLNATASTSTSLSEVAIYRNGIQHSVVVHYNASTAYSAMAMSIADLVYLNGTTDYVELFGREIGTGTLQFYSGVMSGFLVRPA